MAEGAKSYEVIIPEPAKARYFNQILEYLEQHFNQERVNDISKRIFQDVSSLKHQPYRRTKELSLNLWEEEFRFILFRETRILEIKIIYWIAETTAQAFVTDLFPTRMNPFKMGMSR